MNRPIFEVRDASYAEQGEAIRAVRFRVFVEEQKVPAELEMDERDPVCSHVVAWSGGTPVGTGRLLDDGHIGRVAVLAEWRGKGVGCAIMRQLMDAARSRGMAKVELAAQTHAVGFYERLGFQVEGQPFQEAGIEHVSMVARLPAAG